MAVVGNGGASLGGIASRHGMVVAVHVCSRLAVVDGRQQLRAHVAHTLAHATNTVRNTGSVKHVVAVCG